ncbi:hypothetical protein GALMADRAFT_228008 [Galerina marginata CBS 339.88]|uniref:Uncharacterized protein n=1 Tax=Galerina marginata (strain CBS 339.88) TaxID=685588 RepID=A0A067T0W5_GALM3|nr:hypothetical protein GALMADRAFT_228008 [Galerina marginata CBS 339.88]
MDIQRQVQLPEVYKALIAERDSLLAKARVIAEKCNGLAPISKLMPEIMLRIFALNSGPLNKEMDHGTTDLPNQRSIDPTKDLRIISQVCQHWRVLALRSPTLWNVALDCNLPPQWMAELLRRSQSIPFKMRVDLLNRQPARTMANFRSSLPEFHRLEGLTAFADDSSFAEILFKLIKRPLPMLRMLVLTINYEPATYPEEEDISDHEYESSVSDDPAYDEDECFLPEFPDESCKILTLATRGCLFRLDSPIYQNLTDLSVFEITGKIPLLSEWISCLQKIENLTSLVLVHAMPKHRSMLHMPQLSLPHLTDLRLVGHSASCCQFLDQLAINPLRSFDIRFRHAIHSKAEMMKLVDVIIPHLDHQAKTNSFDSLKIIFTNSHFEFTNTESPKKFKPYFRVHLSSVEGFRLRVSNASDSDSGDIDNYDDAQGPSHFMMNQVLIALMTPFVPIKSIQIDYETTLCDIGIHLPMSHKTGTPAATMQQLFPVSPDQLRSLTMSSMGGNLEIDMLKAYLMWRIELGKPLEHLRFTSHRLNRLPDHCEQLRQYCGTLTWEKRAVGGYMTAGDSDGDMVSMIWGS